MSYLYRFILVLVAVFSASGTFAIEPCETVPQILECSHYDYEGDLFMGLGILARPVLESTPIHESRSHAYLKSVFLAADPEPESSTQTAQSMGEGSILTIFNYGNVVICLNRTNTVSNISYGFTELETGLYYGRLSGEIIQRTSSCYNFSGASLPDDITIFDQTWINEPFSESRTINIQRSGRVQFDSKCECQNWEPVINATNEVNTLSYSELNTYQDGMGSLPSFYYSIKDRNLKLEKAFKSLHPDMLSKIISGEVTGGSGSSDDITTNELDPTVTGYEAFDNALDTVITPPSDSSAPTFQNLMNVPIVSAVGNITIARECAMPNIYDNALSSICGFDMTAMSSLALLLWALYSIRVVLKA